LLKAIFGSKAGDVKDTSLRVPPGVNGTVIDIEILTRKGVQRENRVNQILAFEQKKLENDRSEEITIILKEYIRRLAEFMNGSKLSAKLKLSENVTLDKNKEIKQEDILGVVDEISKSKVSDILKNIKIKDDAIQEKVVTLTRKIILKIENIEKDYEIRIEKLFRSDDLSPGEIKRIRVFVAVKRKLQVGDKMAGRHGNKGVISRIMPIEDMPFMRDGTPVDIVLNPLGVPSRMNVGQVLETHLGWAAKEIGKKISELTKKQNSPKQIKEYLKAIYHNEDTQKLIDELADSQVIELADSLRKGVHVATPVFDGAFEDEIFDLVKEAGFADSGKTTLYDGVTGEKFEFDVTVGVMYMLKLNHLVEDKLHARCTGPYSLVTQQPLGGKAQLGGQRLGEMEVWALEAYGAAYTLQEFLSVKSDDVIGRTRIYDQIVKGNPTLEPGIPESFNVLFRELQGLALDVELLESEKELDKFK